MSTRYLLRNYEPQQVLTRFEDICAIPHGSNNEGELGAYICRVAGENHLQCDQDDAGNILIRMPASSGFEDAAPLLLQGHIDMVCVKTGDADIDMDREPVRLVLENGVLHADGTSLGADNAVGVSLMLAVMSDPSLQHPPLELLFTTGEEIGLVGIRQFDLGKLTARRMINFDCGDPDVLTIGSAGSAKYTLKRECFASDFCGQAVTVRIDGLLGGHSGIETGKNRASAIELAGRLLDALSNTLTVRLVALESERAATGIPRWVSLTVGFDAADESRAFQTVRRMDAVFHKETEAVDTGYRMTVSAALADQAISAEDTRALSDLMLLIPHDVSRRSNLNLAWPLCSALLTGVNLENGLFSGVFSVRANMDAYREACVSRMKALLRLCGAHAELISEAPAWPAGESSALRELCLDRYEALFHAPMQQELIHGTLEVGVIKATIPDMDIVGFAPKSRGAHTTDERLYVDTVQPVWELLKAVLAARSN